MQLSATTGISTESSRSRVSGFQPANISTQGSCYASALEAFISSQNGSPGRSTRQVLQEQATYEVRKEDGNNGFQKWRPVESNARPSACIHSGLSQSTSTSFCPGLAPSPPSTLLRLHHAYCKGFPLNFLGLISMWETVVPFL